MFKCPICDFKHDKLNSLSIHFSKTHKQTSKQLYILLNCENGIEPSCKCGCEKVAKFLNVVQGFRNYIRGHASRINNNWGHNKKALVKSQKKRKQMIESGEWKPFVEKESGMPWNLGKTKENDERIKRRTDNLTNEQRKVLSDRMRKGRMSGRIPTARGENSGNWKGGYSALSVACASNKKLYNEWKFPILKRDGFSCKKCGRKNVKLHVHHDKERMSNIVRSIAGKNNWPENLTTPVASDFNLFNLKQKIIDEVAEYHIVNNVSGIVLCSKCHKEEHVGLNF